MEFDTDKDGKISKAEMKVALRQKWPEVTDDQVETIIQKMDADKDGVVSKQEMVDSTIAQGYADGKVKNLEEVAPVEPKKPEEQKQEDESSGLPTYTWAIFIAGGIVISVFGYKTCKEKKSKGEPLLPISQKKAGSKVTSSHGVPARQLSKLATAIV